MPIIKSAKKKMRQDRKRKKSNQTYLKAYRRLLKKIKETKTSSNIIDLIKKAYSKIDRAKKRKIIHKNKAARLKSALAKFLKNKKTKKTK
jgi:small subunit ribosomal protein S20